MSDELKKLQQILNSILEVIKEDSRIGEAEFDKLNELANGFESFYDFQENQIKCGETGIHLYNPHWNKLLSTNDNTRYIYEYLTKSYTDAILHYINNQCAKGQIKVKGGDTIKYYDYLIASKQNKVAKELIYEYITLHTEQYEAEHYKVLTKLFYQIYLTPKV